MDIHLCTHWCSGLKLVIFIFYASEISEKNPIHSKCIIEDQWNILVSFLHILMISPLFSFNAPSPPTQPIPQLLGLYCTYHHSTQVFCCEALKCFPYSSSSICQSNHHYPATEDNQINHLNKTSTPRPVTPCHCIM